MSKRNRSWVSILLNQIEVLDGHIIVGRGMMYYDGRNILRPDIISLSGDTLPIKLYNLRCIDYPVLAVLVRTIQ